MLLLMSDPLFLGQLALGYAQFVSGDLGRDLFQFYFSPPFRCSLPSAVSIAPLYSCICQATPMKLVTGGKMKTVKGLMRFAVFVLAVLSSALAWGQTSNGTVVGSVVDPTGAVVQNATISAVSSEYGQPHETKTDSVGTYRLESLQPGIYSVSITAPAFETITVTGGGINGSLTTTINGTLKLAAAQQTIEVQATAGQAIDTQSGQLGENISHQEVAQLPYFSLNPAELAMTLPGVQASPLGKGLIPTAAETNGIAFSVNGTRPRANNFLIDSQDDN